MQVSGITFGAAGADVDRRIQQELATLADPQSAAGRKTRALNAWSNLVADKRAESVPPSRDVTPLTDIVSISEEAQRLLGLVEE